jgi:DNA repair exonuclease SbcCD ATPase subunit
MIGQPANLMMLPKRSIRPPGSNGGSSRTVLIMAIALVLLMISSGLLFTQNQALRSRTAELEAQSEELNTLRESEKELQSLRSQLGELERLRKDNQELLRLRNEARLFREQREQLTKMSAENQALQARAQQLQQLQVENRQAPPQPAAAPPPPAADPQVAACINNLRQLKAAIQQWALDHQKRVDETARLADLAAYFPATPVCPQGGTYIVSRVADPPKCSVPGHQLAE